MPSPPLVHRQRSVKIGGYPEAEHASGDGASDSEIQAELDALVAQPPNGYYKNYTYPEDAVAEAMSKNVLIPSPIYAQKFTRKVDFTVLKLLARRFKMSYYT